MKNQTTIKTIGFVVILLVFVSISNASVIYCGSLTSTSDNLGSIQGKEGWINPGSTTIEWKVADNDSYWHYKYVLIVPSQPEISHFIIGVSDQFTIDNIWNATSNFGATEIGYFDQDNGNPSIPATLHGLKFDETFGTTLTIEFDSNRRAVWGDFYAKGGGKTKNEAWNAGITLTDPVDPPANGSINNHILVPDSILPEPTTILLLSLGSLAMLKRKRK